MKRYMLIMLLVFAGVSTAVKADDFGDALQKGTTESQELANARMRFIASWLLNQAAILELTQKPNGGVAFSLISEGADQLKDAMGQYYTKGKKALEQVSAELASAGADIPGKLGIIKGYYGRVRLQLGAKGVNLVIETANLPQ